MNQGDLYYICIACISSIVVCCSSITSYPLEAALLASVSKGRFDPPRSFPTDLCDKVPFQLVR
jgi:hypothetical protein